MANISEKVEQIRKAIYGKDVRESIASGIEAINDHVETVVEAEVTREANEVERETAEEIRETNERARETAEGVRVEAEIARQIEVTNARESTVKSKTFATLGERLEESEQDLANHETAADPHDQYALDTDLATLQTEVTSHKADYASQIAKTIKHIGGVTFGGNTSREFVLSTGTYLMITKGNNNAPSYFELIGVIDSGSTHESIVPVNSRASIVYEGNKITVTHVGWGTCRIIKIN